MRESLVADRSVSEAWEELGQEHPPMRTTKKRCQAEVVWGRMRSVQCG